MIWKATLTTSVSSISLRTTLSKSIDHRAQCFYLKKQQQQQQPAATLQYSQKTFLVRTNWGPKGRNKNLKTAPAPFLKVWMTAPSPPPPLPRPLSPAPSPPPPYLARKSIAIEWSLAIWFRPTDSRGGSKLQLSYKTSFTLGTKRLK